MYYSWWILKNNWFLIALEVIIFLFTLHFTFCIYIFLLLSCYIIFKFNFANWFIITFLAICFTLLILVNYWLFNSVLVHSFNPNTGTWKVIGEKEKYYILLCNNHYKFIFYKNSFQHFKLQETFYVKNILIKNFKHSNAYFYSLNIRGVISHLLINKASIHHQFHLRNLIIDYFTHPKNNNWFYNLGLLLVFNIHNNVNNSTYHLALSENIIQFFVISGIHISCLALILKSIFIKIKYFDLIFLIILFFYIYALNFSLPALRCFVCYLLSFLFGFCKRIKLTKLDNLSICCLIFLIINWHLIYNLSFQFVFLITLSLYLIKSPNKKKSAFIYHFKVNLTGYLTSAFLLYAWHLNINPAGFFLSFIFLYLIEILYVFFFFAIYLKPFLFYCIIK